MLCNPKMPSQSFLETIQGIRDIIARKKEDEGLEIDVDEICDTILNGQCSKERLIRSLDYLNGDMSNDFEKYGTEIMEQVKGWFQSEIEKFIN